MSASGCVRFMVLTVENAARSCRREISGCRELAESCISPQNATNRMLSPLLASLLQTLVTCGDHEIVQPAVALATSNQDWL